MLELKNTFFNMANIFKKIFNTTEAFKYIKWLKDAISLFLAGITTPFILIFCYVASMWTPSVDKEKTLSNQSINSQISDMFAY